MSTNPAITTNSRSVEDVLQAATSKIHVLNPAAVTVTRLLKVYEPNQHPDLMIYAPKATYDTAITTFPFILQAASKIDSEGAKLLEVSDAATLTDEHANTLVTDNQVLAVLWGDDTPHVTGIENPDVAASLENQATTAADAASEYDLHAPSRSDLLDAFEDRLGDSFVEQYTAVLEALDELSFQSGREAAIDTAIFVGALTEAQFYHVSRSTEPVEFGSQASYSRRKNALEDDDYIETEKIPIDVGRPRQRLVLSNDIEQSTDAVVEVLHSLHRDRVSEK